LLILHDDAGSIFQALYSMGVVEKYFVQVWDEFGLDEEQKHPQWHTNSIIEVTFKESK